MTNSDIITNTAIYAGLYTKESAMEAIKKHGELPLHTFSEWKQRGYSVKKGEHAKLVAHIWKYKKETTEMPTTSGETVIQEGHEYYKVKAYFFTDAQVERLPA